MRPLFAIAPLALALALLGPSAQNSAIDPSPVQAFLDWITPDDSQSSPAQAPLTADSSTASSTLRTR